MHMKIRSRRGVAAVLSVLLIGAATACGDDDDVSTEDGGAAVTEATTNSVASPSTEQPAVTEAPIDDTQPDSDEGTATAGALEDLVAAANEEGALMIYSEMAPGALENISAAFEAEYPEIDVEFVRDIHPNLAPTVDTEMSTGRGVGDVFITTSTPWFEEKSGTGAFLPLEGRELAGEGAFDASLYVKNDDYLITGGTINVYAWNSGEVPEGIEDPADFLDPAFDGRIGLPDPVAPVNVEWYTWLEQEAGITLEELAELHPPRVSGRRAAHRGSWLWRDRRHAVCVPDPRGSVAGDRSPGRVPCADRRLLGRTIQCCGLELGPAPGRSDALPELRGHSRSPRGPQRPSGGGRARCGPRGGRRHGPVVRDHQ